MANAASPIGVRLGRPVAIAIRSALETGKRGGVGSYRFFPAASGSGPVWIEAGQRAKGDDEPRSLFGEIEVTPASATDFGEAVAEWRGGVIRTTGGDEAGRLRLLAGASHEGELGVSVLLNPGGGEAWRDVEHIFLEGEPGAQVWVAGERPAAPDVPPERVARFTSSFGEQAWQRLQKSTAVVIGAGGTGSITIPMLARAGVGRIVIVDSDHITPSNLERTHGAFPEHVTTKTLKAELARDHVRAIDPDIEVIAFEGRLPQPEIVAEIARADVIVGCTDQHTSRLAVSDMARRYLVPAIDCGGLIEGANGRVTGQIIQLVAFRPDDPCPLCRGMIDPVRVKQELMSQAERERLLAQAQSSAPPPEANEVPQIDTVGYITTVSGTLAAGYAIGWLTGRFDPPFERLQMNLIADCLDVTNRPQRHLPSCSCRDSRGRGDLGVHMAPFAVPDHWKPARRIG